MTAPGVTTSGTDGRANRVSFSTTDAAARDRLAERLGAMDELPCGLVVVGGTGILPLR